VRAAEQAATRAASAARAIGAGARASLREALPEATRGSFVSEDGRFAITLHPSEDIWEGDADARFVEAMRRVDPSVTGAPVTVIESMRLMTRSFLEQAALATAFVTLLLLFDYRCWRLTALSMLSLAMGLAWTFGAMALLEIPLNLANFFAIPVMIGLAVDSCIHVTHRAVDGGLQIGFGSTRRAVIVTALTTTIDFGTLLFAQHRGMQSLGAVMTIASLACLASSVWLLPAMLRVAGFGRVRVATSAPH
jgi:predicted RND superfamily exporter protein